MQENIDNVIIYTNPNVFILRYYNFKKQFI